MQFLPCGAPSPTELLEIMKAHTQNVDRMLSHDSPTDLLSLIEYYEQLGQGVVISEACLVAAFDALDPKVGNGQTEDIERYEAVKTEAYQLLCHCGSMFANLAGPFKSLVHQGGGWSNQPVVHEGQTLYRNTFKTDTILSPEERRAEYEKRVQKFLNTGGSFDDIILLDAQNIRTLKPWAHYDYVMLPNYEIRVYPTAVEDRNGKPKAGHSLLIGAGEHFADPLILSAGELWILQDHAGDLETVIIASNSGHFKPDFSILEHTLPGLELLQVQSHQVAQFGGPNNIPAIFREIKELHNIDGLENKLPPDPTKMFHS